MGLPVEKFIAATNANDVFPQYLETGEFNAMPSKQTISNAMDVGMPSNFDRILKIYNENMNELRRDLTSWSFQDNETKYAIKYTKNNITLGSIKNVPLNVFDTGGQKRIAWNGTNFILEATNVNGSWVDNASSIVTLNSTNAWNGLNFYSQALGGDGIVELTYSNGFGQAPDAPADNATVIFNTQSPVFPGDSVPANLACYRNCPDPANLASGTEVAGSIYLSLIHI